jgi:hypothetical protein
MAQSLRGRLGTETLSRGRGGTEGPLRRWGGALALLILPFLLIAGGYYRPVLLSTADWPISGDAAFYTYQFTRVGELQGQWWKLGRDERVGAPYQPEFGKHPGVYEGVDLLMVSTLTSRFFDPVTNYHVVMMVVLVVNGWIVGWLVRRLSGSWGWAALGVILLTWNYSTAFRLQGHAHLFKYGWTILAALAFSKYLDEPMVRRGFILGLAMALVLQGSFYLGSFLGLACGVWWIGALVAGRLGWSHVRAAVPALLCFAAAGLALTFPVWAPSRSKLLADSFQGHGRIDAWYSSAALWQYFLSPASKVATLYIAEFNARLHTAHGFLEGWHYPGRTVLLALGVYLVFRLRSRPLPVSEPRLLDRFMGLSGLLVLLSLAGGPSFFLVSGIGCFRAYGRAGLLSLALWCVAAPVILQTALRGRGGRLGRLAFLSVLAMSLHEGYQATAWFPCERRMEEPAWVDWLRREPPEVHLAAFPPARERPGDWWGYEPLLYQVKHRHVCLNGSDSLLFMADLKLLGATYEKMNPAALRFVVSLGYDSLAFHRDYLEANPWIASLPWLESVEVRGPWWLCRANQRLKRLPQVSLDQVLSSWSKPAIPIEVPAESWITDRFDLPQDVVVGPSGPVWLAWMDERGRLIGPPSLGLYQHIFGPEIPAFSVKTPRAPGSYRLVFLDERRQPLQSRRYQVRPGLETILSRVASPGNEVDATALVTAVAVRAAGTPEVLLENTSAYYLQANTSREQVYLPSARAHPGTFTTSIGSVVLKVGTRPGDESPSAHELTLLLPCDLPPRSRVKVALPEDRLEPAEPPSPLQMLPHFFRQDDWIGQDPRPAIQVVRGRPAQRR